MGEHHARMDIPPGSSALPASVRTLAQLFAWRVTTTPQTEAYRQFDAARGVWAT